jgi:hypothetical protein
MNVPVESLVTDVATTPPEEAAYTDAGVVVPDKNTFTVAEGIIFPLPSLVIPVNGYLIGVAIKTSYAKSLHLSPLGE